MITRTLAAGGAAICLGAAYDISTPNADALSILLPGRTVDGVGTTTRINILEGNIFNPQLGIGGTNSNNSTIGNVVMNQGNNIVNQLLSQQIRLGGAAGNGNTTQINILSYNIFNPQISLIGRNISNNTSVNNVAANNGNNSTTDITTGGGLLPWLGGAAGNGNTTQFAFFSGNIFNPQWSMLGGGNLSNNTTFTNVAIGNGNYSQATLSMGGWFGTFLMGGGNGNTTQFGFFVSNIYNPQWTFGGGNMSNNTAATNTSAGNGNNSGNEVTGGGLGGTTGNGNTNQTSAGSGNIYNDQVNVGPGSATTVTSNTTNPVVQQLGIDSVVAAANTGVADDDDSNTNLQSQQEQRESFSASTSGDSTSSTTPASGSSTGTDNGGQPGDTGTGDTGAGDTGGGDTSGDGGDDSGSSGV
jgi:hypothetical protein